MTAVRDAGPRFSGQTPRQFRRTKVNHNPRYAPREAHVKPLGPHMPAHDMLLCAWQECGRLLVVRIRGSGIFQLEPWQEDGDGGWELALTDSEYRRRLKRQSRQRLERQDATGMPAVVSNERGWRSIPLPTHFHCPLDVDHVNTVTS